MKINEMEPDKNKPTDKGRNMKKSVFFTEEIFHPLDLLGTTSARYTEKKIEEYMKTEAA